MRNKVIWAIRDARGLTAKEKMFLLITESRGELYGHWRRNAEDMGLSKRGYYDARKSLMENGLVVPVRRMNNTTIYSVNEAAFPYGEKASPSGNDSSPSGNAGSHVGNERSRTDETKKTLKNNIEEELERELEENHGAPVVADAPTVTLPNHEVRGKSKFALEPCPPLIRKEDIAPDSRRGNERLAVARNSTDTAQDWMDDLW